MTSALSPQISSSSKPRISWLSNAKLLRALYEGEYTINELAEQTGLAISTVRGYVKALRNERLVRICDKRRNSRGAPVIHVYEWAPDKRDATFAPVSGAERASRYRERLRLRRLQSAITGSNTVQRAGGIASPSV